MYQNSSTYDYDHTVQISISKREYKEEGRTLTPLLSQAGLLSSGIARTQGVTTAIDAGRAPPEPAAAFTRVVARQAGASVGFPLVGLHLRHTRRWAGAATSEYAGNDKTHDDALHQHCSLRWGARWRPWWRLLLFGPKCLDDRLGPPAAFGVMPCSA